MIHGDRIVFLVGFMGSGKSAVGRSLATEMGYDFEDTDALVVEALGRPIEQVFLESGEGFFRDAEWRALQGLSGCMQLVVATGGGLFLGLAQRRFMREHGVTVWLDVPLSVARARVGGQTQRPLWTANDPVAFRAFFEKRRAAYALADIKVDAEGDDLDIVAHRVHERLQAFSH